MNLSEEVIEDARQRVQGKMNLDVERKIKSASSRKVSFEHKIDTFLTYPLSQTKMLINQSITALATTETRFSFPVFITS